jgi:hypothetical protein
MTTPSKMPSRIGPSAPKFDGKPETLISFVDDVEQLADECKLDDKQKIEWLIRYGPVEERDLWELQPAVALGDWKKFKDELYQLYPGSTGDRRYSIGNLEMLAEKQAMVPIENSAQFGEYYRAFSKIANFLSSKGRISERERSNMFLRGLEYSLRTQVRNQLRAENPTHHTDDPWTLTEISKVALFVLSCGGEEYRSMPSPVIKEEAAMKRETFDLSKIGNVGGINLTLLAQEVAKQIAIQNENAPRNNAGAYRNATNQPRVRSNECLFCSDPSHFIPNCLQATEYLQKGLCKKNNEGFFIFNNGDRIMARTAPGKDIKERVDNWNKTNPFGSNVVSTNFFETEERNPSQFVWIEEEVDESQIPSQREVEDIQMLENLVATTQRKIDETRKRNVPKGQGPAARATIIKERAKNNEQETTEPAGAKIPQYKYSTPIEDESVVKKVVQQALDSSLTLTTREVLAIAPDVRKVIKDQITTKRMAAVNNLNDVGERNEHSMFMASLPVRSDNLIVAKQTEELRSIDAVLEGKVAIEATVDDGSQIIGIRRDKWEELGIPMRSDHLMVMESANMSKDQTLGLLTDLKLTIGENDFYLQIQVIENAPYELLLGRPFFTLTQATTRHFTNGDSQITLVDPNTGAVLTVPTRQRTRHQRSQSSSVGF